MSLKSKLKLKHIFITSIIIASSISTNTIAIITAFIPPIKQSSPASAFALSDEERYDSGYDHGCSDVKTGDHQYLENSGGKSSHTAPFMRGYDDGYSKCHNPSSKSNGDGDDGDDGDDGVSDSNAKGTDSEPDDEIPLSKQKENTNSPNLPNSTSFHALTFPKIHFIAFVLIVLSLGLVLSVLGLAAFRRLRKRRKFRERKGFPNHVKEKILRKQDHKCARCRKILNVVDWDHKNGDRSNNQETNCQALCPNCHATKTRKEQGKR